jgi:hypothetical protein
LDCSVAQKRSIPKFCVMHTIRAKAGENTQDRERSRMGFFQTSHGAFPAV